MIRGAIFDLGSTLIRRTGLELERVKCAALASFAASDCGCRDPETFGARLLDIRLAGWKRSEEELVEIPAAASFAEAFAAVGLDVTDAILSRAEAIFFEPEVTMSRLYPSALETLEALAGMGLRLGMISNATSHRLVVDIARRHGIDRYFDPLVTSMGFGRPKPHPDIFRHVLDAWKIEPDAAVMIGDNLGADILGANTVGMRSILVDIEPNPDNPKFTERAAPNATVTRLEEIPALIRGWNEAPRGRRA
ncbi:MAG TPA: HAD family hydrolase [bacterium]|nr:HAD family hydrolase [bacterium]